MRSEYQPFNRGPAATKSPRRFLDAPTDRGGYSA